MAQQAVGGPGAEFHLGHQVGAHEADAARLVRGQLARKGAFVDAQFVQLVAQLLGDRGGKAGADPSHIIQLAMAIDAQGQGTDQLVRRGGRHKARHHEFLPRRTFRLDPCLAAPRPIRRIGLLGDDALQAQAAGMAQHHGARLSEMVAVSHPARIGPHQIFQHPLAFDQRCVAQVMAI